METPRILWGRVILYGILVEAVLTAIFIAGLAAGVMSPGMTTALALVGSFLLPLLFAASLGTRLQARFALHGMLIGAIAFAVFMTMSMIGRFFQPDAPGQPIAYWIAHALKLVGGGLGGAIASRRRKTVDTLSASPIEH
jgi:putative membrane protein (TIGR04086 family)